MGNESNVSDYKKLEVWKESYRLALEVYRLTNKFPKEHRYELTSQINRAVLSIPNNLVEGSGSTHSKEFVQFLNISYRSANEVEFLLMFAKDMGLIPMDQFEELENRCKKVKAMLGALRRVREKKSLPSSSSFSSLSSFSRS